MADALLSAVATTILDNINSLWLQEFGISGGLKTELEMMQSSFTTIQAVLLDAEEKQWKSEAIKNWLRKLKDAAYEVDDILDEFATNTHRGRLQRDSRTLVISSSFAYPKQLLFRSKIARKLKNVREKLDAIAGERSKFHLREGMEAVEDGEVSDREWRKTSSLVNESKVVGRDKELEKVINMVLNNSAEQDGISVYALCGMGGLGKTTFAQLVYNHESIEKAFDLRIWVCVSDEFDITRLTKAIIESVGGNCNIQELDPLQRHLQEKLSGKRFLLVLDDVWNEYHDKWEALKEAFRRGAKGSTVLVTTRIEKVALMMTNAPIHHLGCLSNDDSWSLFKQRAFRVGKSEEFPHLEAIGKEIVKKCGGVPLALKTLGSLMCFKARESDWLSVKDSKMWELGDEGSRVEEVLRLSYRHLKPHLRQCFSFCSMFPKDHIMSKKELVRLWMANGFVPSRAQMNLHDIGCEIFDELAWRSFFQEVKGSLLGDVTCKMHDIVHDLAQSIMRYECFIQSNGEKLTVPKTVRHMFAPYNSSANMDNLPKICSLRSLIMHSDAYSRIAHRQKHLRALVLNCDRVKISIDNFKYLRYVRFYNYELETLPESLCALYNLQTLSLSCCNNLLTLPKGMKQLKNLIYLEIEHCAALASMPVGLGQLSSLCVLSMFIVGKDRGCFIDELKSLALEGELCIKELDNVKSSTDARSANLILKQNLISLSLSWSETNKNNLHENAEEVLSGLQPHSSLKNLSIRNYHSPRFSYWLMDLLVPNLIEISLENCGRCECLPPLGKLRFLKVLAIYGMNALKSINSSFYGDGEISFPSLESLSFSCILCLEEWTTVNGRETFPLLTSLKIGSCPKLVELPMLPSLNNLVIGEDCNVPLLSNVMHFTSLTSLSIGGFFTEMRLPDGLMQNHKHIQDLTILPEGLLQHHKNLQDLTLLNLRGLKSLSDLLDNLFALKRLVLQNCEKLECLPAGVGNLSALKELELTGCLGLECLPTGLENLSCLEKLYLSNCDSLISLPENGLRGLSSLSSLWIQNCKKLESLSNGVRYLTSLQYLLISGSPELKSLPDSIQHLSALRSLSISHCEGLTCLPDEIEHLMSLSKLEIRYCPNLMSLPRGIKSLTALTDLRIIGCPCLERRCKIERGEDWPFIAHIPYTQIMSNEEFWERRRRSSGSLLTRTGDWAKGLSRKLFLKSQSTTV